MKILVRAANKFAKVWFQKRVRSRKFSTVSNDCWGGGIYPTLGLAYQTPFVGLFVMSDAYLRLLARFLKLIEAPLTFKTSTRNFPSVNRSGATSLGGTYPIGVLGDEIEVHFMHYASPEEAQAKWQRRLARLRENIPDRLFFRLGAPGEVFSRELLTLFDALPFAHKVVFVGTPQTASRNAVFMPSAGFPGRIPPNMHQEHLMFRNPFFDLADWLNGGSGQPHGLYRLFITHLLPPREFAHI